jgi:hypothetical protein
MKYQKSEIRNQKSEIRNQKSEIRNQIKTQHGLSKITAIFAVILLSVRCERVVSGKIRVWFHDCFLRKE